MKCRDALRMIDFQIPEEDETDFNIIFVNHFFNTHYPTYQRPKKYFRVLMNQIIEKTDLDIRCNRGSYKVNNYYNSYYKHYRNHC